MMEKMKAGRFYGKIVDSTLNKGVEFASVQLIGSVYDTVSKTKKEIVVAGQLTLENGDFSLEKINVMGKFRLKISALGYVPREIPVSFNLDPEKMKSGGGMGMLNAVDKDLGNLKIQVQATQLKSVDIVSTTPVFELKLDKKIFNVDKNMIATGGTAEDAAGVAHGCGREPVLPRRRGAANGVEHSARVPRGLRRPRGGPLPAPA